MTNEERVKTIAQLERVQEHLGSIGETVDYLSFAIKALEAQPCEDCISRQAVLNGLANIAKAKAKSDAQKALMGRVMFFTEQLPPVTPQYTDEEIDKIQEIEQAYVDKMVELAVEESKQKWLESFDTSSATKCFEAVNILKERLEEKE